MMPFRQAARRLAVLYGESFGGKPNGRYRMSAKQIRQLLGRRRLYEDDIRDLTRALLEEGFVLVDMDGFFVVLSANTFVNYRRLSAESLEEVLADENADGL